MKKILWITRMAPADIDSAGLIHQYRYLEILSSYYEITVVSIKEDYGTNPLLKLGIKAVKFTSNEKLLNLVKSEKFDLLIFNWWDLANQFLQMLYPYVKKAIVNTIDVEFVRAERKRQLGINVKDNKFQECKTYSWAEQVWFITEQDKNAVIESCGLKSYKVFPLIQKIQPPRNLGSVNRRVLYFIGNYLHAPNVDASVNLCKNIFPKLLERHPELELYIFGKWPPKELQECKSDKIHVTGIVYDLPKYLKHMGICVANLRWGAGLKGKVTEAMSNQIPVVGSSIAFEGLNVIHGQNCMICESTEDYIENIDILIRNENQYIEIAKNAYELMKPFTANEVEPKLITAIEEIL